MGLSHRQSKNNDYQFCLVLYDGLLTLDFTLVIRPVHRAGAGELGLCGEHLVIALSAVTGKPEPVAGRATLNSG